MCISLEEVIRHLKEKLNQTFSNSTNLYNKIQYIIHFVLIILKFKIHIYIATNLP